MDRNAERGYVDSPPLANIGKIIRIDLFQFNLSLEFDTCLIAFLTEKLTFFEMNGFNSKQNFKAAVKITKLVI